MTTLGLGRYIWWCIKCGSLCMKGDKIEIVEPVWVIPEDKKDKLETEEN